LVLGLDARVQHTTLLRSTGEGMQARRQLAQTSPEAALLAEYAVTRQFGLRVRAGRGIRLEPDLWTSDGLHRAADATELGAFGTLLSLGRWSMHWNLTGFGAVYGSQVLQQGTSGRIEVAGAEAGLDFRDESNGLSLRLTGGPMFARLAEGGA